MRAGFVDIGTNTLRLLIVEENSGNIKELERKIRITRLGKGLFARGIFDRRAILRSKATIREWTKLCEKTGCDLRVAAATEALRFCTASEFLNFIEREGWQVYVLAEKAEAFLGFIGAERKAKRSLVVDVGGGSTDFSWGETVPAGYKSVKIGSVRITEAFFKHDPPRFDEIMEAAIFIWRQIEFLKELDFDEIVAIAGTATSLAALKKEVEPYDPFKVHNTKLSRSDLASFLWGFSLFDSSYRRKFKGISPGRADVIFAGALILTSILLVTGKDWLRVSDRDTLHGLALLHLKPEFHKLRKEILK